MCAGTIVHSDQEGCGRESRTFSGAREFMESHGVEVMIWTCRNGVQMMEIHRRGTGALERGYRGVGWNADNADRYELRRYEEGSFELIVLIRSICVISVPSKCVQMMGNSSPRNQSFGTRISGVGWNEDNAIVRAAQIR